MPASVCYLLQEEKGLHFFLRNGGLDFFRQVPFLKERHNPQQHKEVQGCLEVSQLVFSSLRHPS